MKRVSVFLLFLTAMALGASVQIKPEIKSTSQLPVAVVGKTLNLTVFGQGLNPKEVTVATKKGVSSIAVKIISQGPTEQAEKDKGASKVVLELAPPADCAPGTYEISLSNPDGAKAVVPIAVVLSVETELIVKEQAGAHEHATPLTGSSVAANGTVRNDSAVVFRFEAKAGEAWRVEVLAGRVGSALDPIVRIRDNRYVSLAISAGNPRVDRHIDFTAPQSGTYYIELSDEQARGGPTFTYRLTLRKTTK